MQADHAGLTDTQQPQHHLLILLVFNLFALEALHIAECLCVPCLAASPCLVPYTFPSSFPRRFRKAWPDLYSRLQTPCEGQSLLLLLLCVVLLLLQLFKVMKQTLARCRLLA